jgi:hypothetical protein
MTPQQRHYADQWLKTKCPNFRCSGCGGIAVRAVQLVDLLVPLDASGVPNVHMVAFACLDCGHTSLFSSGLMGLPGTVALP